MAGVEIRDATVRFGDAEALCGTTVAVEAGEQVAVIGASGAGKSTLFRTLTRSVALRGGKVFVGGNDLYALSRRGLRDLRQRIGTIHQAYNLVPQLSAGANVALGRVGEMGTMGTMRAFVAGPDAALSRRVLGALEAVGLSGRAGVRTADLSGGQQQRVAVARLLVQRPDLILADEPFAAVDPVTTERVLATLLDLNRAGATLLLNLHDVDLARRFPRVVALRQGRVVFDGPSADLSEERLSEIYAGDPRAAEADGPEQQHEPTRIDTPVRVAEGRDGISSH